jgi:hypothetical protein
MVKIRLVDDTETTAFYFGKWQHRMGVEPYGDNIVKEWDWQ